MKAIAIVDMYIHDPEGYTKYPSLVWPLIEEHGGKITRHVSDFENIEGDWCPNRMLIVEFSGKSALGRFLARAFLDDPEYQPVKDIRLRTTRSMMVVGSSEM